MPQRRKGTKIHEGFYKGRNFIFVFLLPWLQKLFRILMPQDSRTLRSTKDLKEKNFGFVFLSALAP